MRLGEKTMKRAHFIGGEKGGVGKSFVARLLAQYYIDSGRAFNGFDADGSHSTFMRFYGEFSNAIDVTDFSSLDQIVETAESQPVNDIIIDTAAQTFRNLRQWIEDTAAFDLLALMGFDTYYWHVMDDGIDSANLLDKLLDAYEKTAANIIVVKNGGRGSDFGLFEQSAIYSRAKSAGVQFLDLDILQPSLAQKVDFSCSSFWAAANASSELSIAERQRVRVWILKQYKRLDQLLGFTGSAEKAPSPDVAQTQIASMHSVVG